MLSNLLARLRTVVLSGGLALWSLSAWAAYELNMPEGVTPISKEVYHLHMLILWICVAIGIGVFGAMFYSIYHHRKSRGAVAAKFHESTVIEIVWTVIPMLILIAMAIPATKALIVMEDTAKGDLTIKVTGYQWKWQYEYLEDGISFFSNLSTPREQIYNAADKGEHYLLEVDNPLVVPVGKKIRILTTAADVIHSWWVPELGFKRDAIPGFINESWAFIEKPGTYRGQCTELCGKDHAYMPIVVVAKSEKDYQQWLTEKKGAKTADAQSADRQWNKDELLAKGKEVYERTCAACHQVNGQGLPPTFPAIKGSAIATGPVEKHLDIVMHGKPGTAMQAFSGQLSDTDIAAVITYQRTGLNSVGDLVQPASIKVLHK